MEDVEVDAGKVAVTMKVEVALGGRLAVGGTLVDAAVGDGVSVGKSGMIVTPGMGVSVGTFGTQSLCPA